MREILEKVFGIVCNLSLVGSYCILLVLVARLVLRRAPRWCSYLLWGIVFLRLCCPVFPQTQISLIPKRLVAGQTVSASLTAPGDSTQNEETAGEKVFTYDGDKLQETGSVEADIRRCWITNDGIYVWEKTAAAPDGQWVLPEE